jgi:hypothetical protein
MKLTYVSTLWDADREDRFDVEVEADLCFERGPLYRKADFKAYYNCNWYGNHGKGDQVNLTKDQWTELNEELQMREFGNL